MLLGLMLRLRPVVDHSDLHHFVRSDEFVIKRPAAVVRRPELLENSVPVLIDAVFIDRAGYHLSHDRQAMEPFFGPDDFTLVVRFAFRYARRLERPGRDSRQAGFLQLVYAARKGQAHDSDLFENLPVERWDIYDEFFGGEHVVIGVFIYLHGEGNTRRFVILPHTRRE